MYIVNSVHQVHKFLTALKDLKWKKKWSQKSGLGCPYISETDGKTDKGVGAGDDSTGIDEERVSFDNNKLEHGQISFPFKESLC